MKKINKKNTFSTRDLWLAATLCYLKFDIIGIDYQIEGRANFPVGYFTFIDNAELQEARTKFFQRALSVEPNEMRTILRTLKSETNNTYKSPHSVFPSREQFSM